MISGRGAILSHDNFSKGNYSPAAVRHNLAIESIVGFLVDYIC